MNSHKGEAYIAAAALVLLAVTLFYSVFNTPRFSGINADDVSPKSTQQTVHNIHSAVNINSASVDELTQISEIGASKAQSIVDYREENGMFLSVDELENVKGIGAVLLEKIREDVTV